MHIEHHKGSTPSFVPARSTDIQRAGVFMCFMCFAMRNFRLHGKRHYRVSIITIIDEQHKNDSFDSLICSVL